MLDIFHDDTEDTVISDDRLHNSLILVVDDVELGRKVIVHSLNARGFKNIVTAEDGSEALQITHARRPDLVVLDIMMPTMDGFAYLQAIRQNDVFKNMPVIVQTALDDVEKKLKAFDLGASDYVCKPIEPRELAARTIVHLSKKLLMEDLTEYKKRMLVELKMARLMQQRLMPSPTQLQMCERVFNMKMGAYFETSSTLGGDCWGMRPISDNRIAIYIIDFSGHGISSSMNLFRMHTVMHELQHAGGDPANFLAALNRHLHPLLERDEFATMFYGIIDTDANCLLYASAASTAPLLVSCASGETTELSGRGFPLGAVANATYDTKYTPFMAGDLLLLYSDALIETNGYDGSLIDEEAIKEEIKSSNVINSDNPAQKIVEQLTKKFKAHNSAPIKDDLTITAYFRCAR